MRYATLAFAMLLFTPLQGVAAPNPPVRVKLSDDRLVRGEGAKVYVQTAADGYLLVLHMDAQGNIRVLFPVDPTDNAAIRGGHKLEVRGRNDREAFTVTERRGGGVVLAARADQPFSFAGFTTGDHWNLAALAPDSATKDPEAAMLGIVDRMSDGHYDYDAVSYTIGMGWGPAGFIGPVGWYGPWYPAVYGLGPWAPYYYGPSVGIIVGPRFGFHGRR